MGLVMIRRNKLGKNDNHSFLLTSTQDGESKNIPYDNVRKALLSKSVEIYNLELDKHGEIKGSNGDLSRYPLVEFKSVQDIIADKSNKIVSGYNSITILGYIAGTKDYIVSNRSGVRSRINEVSLIALIQKNNAMLSNASIVEGKFIRSIAGNFPDVSATADKLAKKLKPDLSDIRREYENNKRTANVGNKTVIPVTKPVESKVAAPVTKPVEKPVESKAVAKEEDYVPLQNRKTESGLDVKSAHDALASSAGQEENMERDYAIVKEQYRKNQEAVELEKADRDARNANLDVVKRHDLIDVTLNGVKYQVAPEIAEELYRAKLGSRYIGNNSGDRELRKTMDTKSDLSKAVGGNGLSLEEKLILASQTLNMIDPFVYAAYLMLDKVYLPEPLGPLSTMGVADDKLLIVVPNVIDLDMSEIAWILLHEVSHIIMQHSSRRQNRNHELFNVACDLFINKSIDTHFGCKPGTDKVLQIYKNVAPVGLRFHSYKLDDENKTVSGGEALFDDRIDIKKDTVESIYAELERENDLSKMPQNSSNENGDSSEESDGNSDGNSNSNQNGDQSNGQKDKSNGKGNKSSKKEENNNNKNDKQNGQGNSDDKDEGQGNQDGSDGQQEQSGQPGEDGKTGQNGQPGQDKNSKQNGMNGQGSSGQSNNNQGQNKQSKSSGMSSEPEEVPGQDIKFRGKVVAQTGKEGDIVIDSESVKHDEEWSKDFLRRVIQRSKGFNGSSDSIFGRMAAEAVMTDVVWEAFVRQYLTQKTEKDYSYKNLNRKALHYGTVMKGLSDMEEDSEDAVYVCIDVSGSVSDEDLYKAIEYIRILLRKLNLKGYVMFWSTKVGEVLPFKNSRDLVKIRKTKYSSTGGTDPNCVFKWFSSNKYRKGKEYPNLIIMITDGQFGALDKSLRPRCETLWIITDADRNYRQFKFEFGKVAPLKPRK